MTTTNEIHYQVGQHFVLARSYEEACNKLDRAYFGKKTRKITIEQANGESFIKRVNQICRYHAKLEGLSDAYRIAAVRQAIERALENCDVVVREQ